VDRPARLLTVPLIQWLSHYTPFHRDVHEAFFVETEAFSVKPEAKTFMSETEALAIPAEARPRPRPTELETEMRPRHSCVVKCLELLQLLDFPH